MGCILGRSWKSLSNQSIATLSGKWNHFIILIIILLNVLIIQVIHEYILNVQAKSSNTDKEKNPLGYSSSVLVSC